MLEIKRQHNLPEMPKPCDYFDFIAGTSTGGFVESSFLSLSTSHLTMLICLRIALSLLCSGVS